MKFAFIFALFLNFAFAKKLDLSHFKIDPNPKEEKEWRPSTIEKVISFCMQNKGSKEMCQCGVDIYKSSYKENEFLKVRARMLAMIENGEDISKDAEIMKFVQKVSVCQKK